MKLALRDYQQVAVDGLRGAYAGGSSAPLLVLATGGGKTVIFSHITEGAAAKGKRVLILVHRQELLNQTSRSLFEIGVIHGVIAAGITMGRYNVQVASVQTLVRRFDDVAGMGWAPDLIVVDEAHHAVAGSWAAVLKRWPSAKVLGVTATPMRMDGKGLGLEHGGFFDRLVQGPSTRELVLRGFLARPVVYRPPMQFSLEGVKTTAGDYNKGQVAAAVDKPKIIGDAITHYRRYCNGMPAIAFCASVEHAQHVAEQFRQAGYRAASLDGGMGDVERRAAIADLGAGRLNVLTSCDIISEGTDIPVVTAAILLRPTQSDGLYLQQVGRALRPVYKAGMPLGTDEERLAAIAAGPKPFAVILDHVGNTDPISGHGLPMLDRDWSLAGRKKAKRGAAANDNEENPDVQSRLCPKCWANHEPAPKCPQCGFEYPAMAREIEQVAGELTEVTDDQAEAERRMKRREVGQAQTLEDLQRLEKARGYKPGWAKHVWKARQGREGHAA